MDLKKILWCTVRLTSTGNPVYENQEFCLALSETFIGQLKKNRSLVRLSLIRFIVVCVA
jgi:hypothetical protein